MNDIAVRAAFRNTCADGGNVVRSICWIKLPITYTASGAGSGTRRHVIAHLSGLGEIRAADVGLFGTLLQGLSYSQYEACAEAVPDMFGLSASSVSRQFIRASAQVLKAFSERRLE
ncbi:MAG TPA: hypothetical protein VN039_02205 [Nitrospira sp.]|nr:hypothetical protein [Nitrospira sp.]